MNYLAIVGSRKRSERKMIRAMLERCKVNTTIVSGGAKGIDTEVEVEAKKLGIPTIIFKPKMDEYSIKGNRVYFERNKRIADLATHLVAFPLNRKGGTMNTIKYFENKFGKGNENLLIVD